MREPTCGAVRRELEELMLGDECSMSTTQQLEAVREGRIHAGFVVPPVDDPLLASETAFHQPIAIGRRGA